MPLLRGISLSVMSQWDSSQFPEFKHPDSPNLQSDVSSRSISSPTISASTSKADRVLGRNPSVSCYIPSIPGVQFFLKYAVQPPHHEDQYFFFRLCMNGHHITSWGVVSRLNPEGYVKRALFEADEKWDIKTKRGKIFKHNGIEKRPFLFTEGSHGKAEDGLIEIQVFRSRGRRKRAPILERFRSQEQYGINLPGIGMVDSPQDMKYFEWVLIDPKDMPYATFYFHYRSWDYLQSHCIIPPSYPRTLFSPNSSDNLQEAFMNKDGDKSKAGDESPFFSGDFTFPHAEITAPHHLLSFGDGSKGGMHPGSPVNGQNCQPKHSWEYDRPLPPLPVRKRPFLNLSSLGRCDHSRRSSTSSDGVSVTPSLLAWLDRSSNNSSPEHFIGVAKAVSVSQLGTSFSAPFVQEHRSISEVEQHTNNRISPEDTTTPPSIPVRKPRKNITTENLSHSQIHAKESDNKVSQETGPVLPLRQSTFPTSETGIKAIFSRAKRLPRSEPRALPSHADKMEAIIVDIDQSWGKEKKGVAVTPDKKHDKKHDKKLDKKHDGPTPYHTSTPHKGNWI